MVVGGLPSGIDGGSSSGGQGPKARLPIASLLRMSMSTLDTLVDILSRDYSVAREQITPEATLETLGLDSLSVLELMFKIEDRYKVKITDDTPTDLLTVSDVVRYIDSLLAGNSATRPLSQLEASTDT
jgi:acyl carrier protein